MWRSIVPLYFAPLKEEPCLVICWLLLGRNSLSFWNRRWALLYVNLFRIVQESLRQKFTELSNHVRLLFASGIALIRSFRFAVHNKASVGGSLGELYWGEKKDTVKFGGLKYLLWRRPNALNPSKINSRRLVYLHQLLIEDALGRKLKLYRKIWSYLDTDEMFYYFKTTRAKVYLIFVFLIAKDDFLSPRVFLFYPNVSRVYLALKMIFTTDHG